ncbi:MAG: LPS export ABC transporter permease LptF [Gammaproteobacteria bacterium]|jgi:lipopolysaccharide export system permease protein
MLHVFDRYLLKEVIHGWLAVTVVLWMILVSNRLVRYLAETVSGDIPGGIVLKLLGLKMLWYLIYVVPFALALGVVLGLGRLYRDNEMTVMSACGVGPWRIYRPLLGFGLIVAAGLGWLVLYVSPAIEDISNSLKLEAKQQVETTGVGAGRFNELQHGRLTFYAEHLSDDKRSMENLFIVLKGEARRDKLPQLLTAQSAYRVQDDISGDDYLVLMDGYRYEGVAGRADYKIMQFDEYGVRIEMPGTTVPGETTESRPTARLLASTKPEDIAELQWRLAMPVSVMVLLFLAVPLCKSGPREGRYGRLVMAILLFVIYYNTLGMAKVWVEQGAVPVRVGLWWVPALPVLLGFAFLNGERLRCLLRLRS